MWRRQAASGCHDLPPAATAPFTRFFLAHAHHPLAGAPRSSRNSAKLIMLSPIRSRTLNILVHNNRHLKNDLRCNSQTSLTKIRTHRPRCFRQYNSQPTQQTTTSEVAQTKEPKPQKPPWWRNMSPDFKVALWSYLVMGTTGNCITHYSQFMN